MDAFCEVFMKKCIYKASHVKEILVYTCLKVLAIITFDVCDLCSS